MFFFLQSIFLCSDFPSIHYEDISCNFSSIAVIIDLKSLSASVNTGAISELVFIDCLLLKYGPHFTVVCVWRNLDYIFLKILFISREGKGGRKRGRETSKCGCLLHTPYWGPGPQPRHVPWLGIEPETLWFTGWRSLHRTTPARARLYFRHST